MVTKGVVTKGMVTKSETKRPVTCRAMFRVVVASFEQHAQYCTAVVWKNTRVKRDYLI